jgi:proteasome lid subunit RPN8/RPN11
VCGVLGGRAGDPVRVEAVRRVPNVAADPTARYELDPAEAVRGIDAVEAAGDHVGFYHSHPRGPAVPSAVDRAEARWPGFVYAVVVPDGSVGAWRDTGDGLEPLTVRVDADG